MANEAIISQLETMVKELLAADSQYFLVNLRIKPTNNVKVFVDGDNGITIERCVKLNRALYKQLEEKALFPLDDYSLEVSSPGVDEPLLLHRQYQKNVGKRLLVTQQDETKLEGELTAVGGDQISLTVVAGKGKKMTTTVHEIAFSNIKQAVVQIVF
jgi:ribosome maturation factor RimP